MIIIKKISFSKLLITFLSIITAVVVVYSMIEMHIQQDLSSLPVLIGATVTECIGCGIFYLKKSMAENTTGGIVYDKTMQDAKSKIDELQNKIYEVESEG